MKNTKFDIDLKYGKEREDRVASLLDKKKNKIEVKTERDWWHRTGNIAIETEYRGKPSGLSVTKADYWVHILAKGKKDYCKLIFDVPTLKKIVRKWKSNFKMIGDNNASKCVLIPLSKLFDQQNERSF
tara:strand:- start:1689 stop:2072 length:384 start_codon:yes stop_codon:yes gene_type:complete